MGNLNGGFIGVVNEPETTGPRTSTVNATNPAFQLLAGTKLVNLNIIAGGGGSVGYPFLRSGGGGAGGFLVTSNYPVIQGGTYLVSIGGGGSAGSFPTPTLRHQFSWSEDSHIRHASQGLAFLAFRVYGVSRGKPWGGNSR